MEHEAGGSGLMSPPNKRWHWLPASPDDDPTQWAHADIWEGYPIPGQPPLPSPTIKDMYCMTRICMHTSHAQQGMTQNYLQLKSNYFCKCKLCRTPAELSIGHSQCR